MLTGRFTYGLGRVDGNSVFSAFIPSSRGLGQTDATATDPFANLSASFSTLFSSFGPLEWGVLLIGGYVLFSTVFTTTRGVKAVKGYREGRARKRKRRRELEQQLSEL